MNSNRGIFLETFAKATPQLKTIFLNHSGNPTRLLTDTPRIIMLADPEALDNFIDYCRTHKLVKKNQIIRGFRHTESWLTFEDGSEMRFLFLRNVLWKMLVCLPVNDIRKEAIVNDFGMLVPQPKHHFEYLFLSHQFTGSNVPDKFKSVFKEYDFESRTDIFRYIQPKYDLVFNTLDDLFTPSTAVLIKIMLGLRKSKPNSLFRIFFRTLGFLFFNITGIIIGKQKTILPSLSPQTESDQPRTAGGLAL
jgi:hypothetical protein